MVFLGNAELKREMPQNVTVGPGGAQYMRLFGAHLLTEAQVTAICEVIESKRLEASRETTYRKHVRKVGR